MDSTLCARGGCTNSTNSATRKYCSVRCTGLARVKLKPEPTSCHREGCPNLGKPRYCSRKCAAAVIAAAKPHEFFVAMGTKGRASLRAVGRDVLRPSDVSLMAQGRYREAARAIYDRGYTAGWVGHHKGVRQLPARRPKKGSEAA